ncbi:peptidase M16 [Emiliania huxleyi CCMP1516]|uniref:Insulin-degrading enzyme n=2 Tax=Emiliania huxleyi TaxID=2903 RepID=A0A0D3I7Q5_EMIH1|nr:peptidase M16 [Emiliania huxleyi CCMP1516]EOD07290.1 peptidase M16 [Emiliania huxleyi CCMP1516]|eukprot:XP_005759719.1 peptidase M16 [Emiliania huxleyi CCMP1516]
MTRSAQLCIFALASPAAALPPAHGLWINRRTLLSHGAAASVLLPLRKAPAAAPAAAGAGVAVYEIASAALDRRSYRGLRLANGLQVLLASDPAAGKAAAAMNVAVGSMSNPEAWQGLAHFCEHMLFLGTASYPDEGDFESYIASNGGSNNAYTDSEETVYFFDVGAGALPGALARFSDFFAAPLFTESATAREVAAIESEHSKNIQSDGWRTEQLLRATRGVSGHPYNGSPHTCYHHGTEPTLDSRLWRYGPPASAKYDPLGLPLSPDQGGGLGSGAVASPFATLVVPVREQRAVSATWCLPVADFDTWLACKPQVALSQLLTARADGSLLSLLKREGLGTAIEVGVEEQTRSFAVVTASLALTEAGLAAWPTAMGHLFSYLRLCREKGALAQLGFRYAEPSQPQAFVTATAASMPLYRPAAWLSGPSLLEGAGGPPTLRQLLGGMTPRAAMVEVCAKEVAPKAPLSEPIYGTRYGRLPIEMPLRATSADLAASWGIRYGRQPIEGEVAAWEAAPLLPELSLPRPNPFIPKRLAIKAYLPISPHISPYLPISPHTSPSLHISQAYFLWRSPEFYTSARTAVTAELFAGMLAEVLQEATYEAAQAGLVAASGVSSDAFTVQLGGYDERLPALATLVASTVRSFEPTQAAFERKVDILRRQLRDAERRQPISLAGYRRGLALQPARFSNEQLAAAAGEEGVLREAQLEAFVAGNLRENEAAEMVRGVRAALPAAPLAAERLPVRRLRRLPPGGATRQFLAGNPEEPNGALEMYLQVGPDEGDDWLHLLLLSQMIDKAATPSAVYAELRTKQQLGYIVQCGSTEADGVRGLVFIVQSSVQPPPELEARSPHISPYLSMARLEAFLRLFRGTLLLTSDEELDTYRESLAAQMQDVDQRADGQASRLWAEVATRRYDFGRPWRSSKRMRRVTRDGLIGFYDKYIAAGGAGRCRLSTHVFSQRSPPKGPLRDDPLPDAFFPPTADGFGVDWAADRAVV